MLLMMLLAFCVGTMWVMNQLIPHHHFLDTSTHPTRSLLRNFRTNPKLLQHNKVAIAFLISGCNERDSCLFFIANILAAKAILDDSGFLGDVVVFVRMTGWDLDQQVPHEDWLLRAGIRIKYIKPLGAVPSFSLAMMDKFRILDLVEYDRVLYLDADAIPLCNLHYLFEASLDGTILHGNAALALASSPVAGHVLLVTPKEGEFSKIMDIVRKATKGRAAFDVIQGWGLANPENWITIGSKTGHKWEFYAAIADQGVLYHWIKYVQKNWTYIWKDYLWTYQEVSDLNSPAFPKMLANGQQPNRGFQLPDGSKVKVVKESPGLTGCDSPLYDRKEPYPEWKNGGGGGLHVDVYHFRGTQPWQQPNFLQKPPPENLQTIKTGSELWSYWFQMACKRWDITLPDRIPGDALLSPLGVKPIASSLYQRNVVIESH